MYRLAVVIGVSWQEFQEMELWQIKSRAFVTGETIIENKVNELDVLMAYNLSSKSKKPFAQQREFENQFKKPLKEEPELTQEEWEQKAIEHNRLVFEEMTNNG